MSDLTFGAFAIFVTFYNVCNKHLDSISPDLNVWVPYGWWKSISETCDFMIEEFSPELCDMPLNLTTLFPSHGQTFDLRGSMYKYYHPYGLVRLGRNSVLVPPYTYTLQLNCLEGGVGAAWVLHGKEYRPCFQWQMVINVWYRFIEHLLNGLLVFIIRIKQHYNASHCHAISYCVSGCDNCILYFIHVLELYFVPFI